MSGQRTSVLRTFLSYLATLIAASAPLAAQGAVTQLGPLPYLSAADNPLVGDPTLISQLEDFEDGSLNISGIVNVPIPSFPPDPLRESLGIVTEPGLETDSVDGDDRIIDGFGRAGRSFRSTYVSEGLTFPPTMASGFSFELLPDVHGNYPTAFGFVWTDGQPLSRIDFGGREVGATGNFFLSYDPSILLGDDQITGETAEDRLCRKLGPLAKHQSGLAA